MYKRLFRVGQYWDTEALYILNLNLGEVILLVPDIVPDSAMAQVAVGKSLSRSSVKDEAQREYNLAVEGV